mgnify:CR=1 FL=1
MENSIWLNWFIPMLLTVISGIIVFFAGEFIRTRWSTPNLEYIRLKGRISTLLSYYANVYTIPVDIAETNGILPERHARASEDFRQLSCELRGFIEQRPKFCRRIPSKQILDKASSRLIFLYSGMSVPVGTKEYSATRKENMEAVEEIRNLLGIYTKELS